MQLTRRRLAAFGVLLLCALAAAVWMMTRPKPLPHPLAIAPAEIAAVTIDGVSVQPGVLGPLLPKLAASRPIPSPAWLEPHLLRVVLRSGVILWIQAMPEGRDVVLRVNADAPANATQAQLVQARRLRALRLAAYRLPAASLTAILTPTDLSTAPPADGGTDGQQPSAKESPESRQKSRSIS